jgi:hypothetical protein
MMKRATMTEEVILAGQEYTVLSLAKKVCTFLAEPSKTGVFRSDRFVSTEQSS